MKSPLLAARVHAIFGAEGEAALRRLLNTAAPQHPALTDGVSRLVAMADALVAQLAAVQRVQAELSGDALADWNLRSGRIDSGRHWKQLLGFSDGDLEDTLAAWRSLVHVDDLERLDAAIAAHVGGEAPFFQCECRLRTRSGAWTWLLVKGKAMARDERGGVQRIIVLQRDVSSFRQSEADALAAKSAAEAVSQARSAFLANMSHEIRTPMNGIIGMTELALDTPLDAEQRHYLRTVKSSAEALLAIVNDILDFSKVEAGKLSLETISFALAPVVFEAVRTQAVAAHRKGLEVVVVLADDVPLRVLGDPTRLRQVIVNLVGNAVKFTERGEIEVRVAVDSQTARESVLCLSVRDTGVGIPEHRRRAIFEAFSQADDSTTRKYGGTGLGLAICSHLVELMGGRIWVESTLGHGACFRFTAHFGRDAEAGELPQAPVLVGKRVLLLADHPGLVAQLQAVLGATGGEVCVAHDPEVAVRLLTPAPELAPTAPFDVVLADAQMGAPCGLALPEYLATRAAGREVLGRTIMLINSEQQREHFSRLRELGVAAHLVKPVAAEDLYAALRLVFGCGSESGSLLDPFVLPDTLAASDAPKREALVVEDNPVNQELAERLLTRCGFKVTLANHGADAVEFFEKRAFDLVFMDMQMPVMDGLEATEAIRSREMRRSWVVSQEFRPVYIVAMTANAMPGDRERCLQAGMNDYVAKPLRPVELDAALARYRDYLGGDLPVPRMAVSSPALPGGAEVSLDLPAALADLGDVELLLTMARMLVGEWDQHTERIAQRLRERNAAALCIDAHTLKSLLAIFHAHKARRRALELEEAAKKGGEADWPAITAQAEVLLAELKRLKPEMQGFVERGTVV